MASEDAARVAVGWLLWQYGVDRRVLVAINCLLFAAGHMPVQQPCATLGASVEVDGVPGSMGW